MDTNKSVSQGCEVLKMAGIAIIFGTEAVIVQLGYGNGFDVLSLAATRFLIASVFYLGLARLKKKPLLVARELWGGTLVLSLLTTGCSFAIYTAVSLIPASLAILFFYAYPSLTALASRLLFHGERLTPSTVLALLLSAVGLVLLYWSSMADINPWGVVVALTGAVLQALRLNLVDRVVSRTDMITFNLDCTVAVAVMYNLAMLFWEKGRYGWVSVTVPGWLIILYLALAVTVAGMYVVYRGIHILGPVPCSLLLLLEPPTTAVMALIIFKDLLTGWQLLGGALILTAVALPQVVQARAGRLRRQLQAEVEEVK